MTPQDREKKLREILDNIINEVSGCFTNEDSESEGERDERVINQVVASISTLFPEPMTRDKILDDCITKAQSINETSKLLLAELIDIRHKDIASPSTKDFIQEHYDEFLGYYYNSPCPGCKDGHSSFWKTIIESTAWGAWKSTNPMYDFAECEELGIMGKEHWVAFLDFIKKQAQAILMKKEVG